MQGETASFEFQKLGWRILRDPPGEPLFNMDRDESIAWEIGRGAPPTLRIYGWSRRALSFPRRGLEEITLPTNSLIPVVRRPTGGGIVEHHPQELTYSVAVPRGFLPEGTRWNGWAVRIHSELKGYLEERFPGLRGRLSLSRGGRRGPVRHCFSDPVEGDLLFKERKVAGSALRVWKNAALLQGSLQGFPVPAEALAEALLAAVARSLAWTSLKSKV